MECFEAVQRKGVEPLGVLQGVRTARNIGIVLLSGFALPEAAAVVEVFQSANALTGANASLSGQAPYKVCLLSTVGGRVDSSSLFGPKESRSGAIRTVSTRYSSAAEVGCAMQYAMSA
jgi:hypothetical protein